MEKTKRPVGRPPKMPEVSLVPEVQKQQEAMPTTVSVNPHYLIQRAIETGNIEAIERMVALQERLQAKWARDQYFSALSKFQKNCPIIERSTQVDFTNKSGSRTKYKYASMDALLLAKNEAGETIQFLLEKHGFSYETKTKQTENDLTAILVSHHRDGHSEETPLTVPIDFESHMSPPQRVRSARTYAIRTAFEDAFGLVTSNPDDDGDAGATEDARNNGETEMVVGEVPQMYWKADRGSAKQQMILVEKYGPALRYEVRKIDDSSAPKGYVWRVVKIDSALTVSLKESIEERKETTPKGEGESDFHKEKQKMLLRMEQLLSINLAAGFLSSDEVGAAKREWNSTKSIEDIAAVYAKYKSIADNKALEADAKDSKS